MAGPLSIIESPGRGVNIAALADAYRKQFPGSEPVASVRAPGRVNLIGEHVDYNDGLVLPIAIDRATYAVAGPAADGRIHIHTATLGRRVEFDAAEVRPPNPPTWDGYAKGVVAGLVRAGVALRGTCIQLDGDLPLGGGLASSAAFEVAVALGMLAVADASLGASDLSRICRQAEVEFAGVPCGIMDPLTCTMGLTDHALLIDCRSGSVRYVPWRDADIVVLIAESGQEHDLSDGAYAARVEECRRAVACFRQACDPIESLRDVTAADLREQQSTMDRVLFRRARHVVTEIRRTESAVRALETGDFADLGRLMHESHKSLCVDFEVSSPRLDRLARFVGSLSGILGARMTGAGFGGCVVALAQRRSVAGIETALRRWYDEEEIPSASLITTRPGPGATTTPLSA